MIEPAQWTSRSWTFGLPADLLPQVLERLRGTPARAEELARALPRQILIGRTHGRWSPQEHLGHLADLHDLDDRRLTEFLARVDVLTAADMSNAATEAARHNDTPLDVLLEQLRDGRLALARRLEALTLDEARIVSVHPRLNQRMSVVDWTYFVAEHDDHHLAHARYAAMRALTNATNAT